MVLKVFISYSQEDYRDDAKYVRDYLIKHTPSCDVFIDQLISKGEKWQERIDAALEECHIFVIFLTNGTIQSIPVKNEVKIAKQNEERAIIPCKDHYLALDWKELPWGLGSYQGIPPFKTKEELGRMLVKEIKDLRKSNKKFKKIDYDTYLDQSFGEAEIADLKFPTSEALKELDPIVYSEGMSEWSIDVYYQELLVNDDD